MVGSTSTNRRTASWALAAVITLAMGLAGCRLQGNVAVSVTGEHTCSLEETGSVRCWGRNIEGQLGDGTTTSRDVPAAVPGLTDVDEVSAGSLHTCSVSSGEVSCWGDNWFGELGDGTATNRPTPAVVAGLDDVTSVSAGNGATCALRADGTVWCWGANLVGTPPGNPSPPAQVPGLTTAVQISVGSGHACAVLADRTQRCWGSDGFGALGDGAPTFGIEPPTAAIGITDVERISAGGGSTCVVRGDGSASCWGWNGHGQIGNGLVGGTALPTTVAGLSDVAEIETTFWHTCAVLTDGTARCWGDNANTFGALGDGTLTNRLTPTPVVGISGAVHLDTGQFNSCVVRSDSSTACWGRNTYGQVGDGTTEDKVRASTVGWPNRLTGLGQIAAGGNATCVVDEGNGTKCFGANQQGNLGDGTTTDRATALPVTGLAPTDRLSAGSNFACALSVDRTVACWGENTSRQLGGGATPFSATPIPVPGLTGVQQIDAGFDHACAVLADQTARCWGGNSWGQLGNGAPAATSGPVVVGGASPLTRITSISTGGSHTCAVVEGGRVACWGHNDLAQTGVGATAVPKQVPGITTAVQVTTGYSHSCALLADGTARCWGFNSVGQLGSGSVTPPTATPVTVAGLDGAVQLTAGWEHTCARRAAGTVTCWGGGTQGQLGDGTTADRASSAPVPSLSDVVEIDARSMSTCARCSSTEPLAAGARTGCASSATARPSRGRHPSSSTASSTDRPLGRACQRARRAPGQSTSRRIRSSRVSRRTTSAGVAVAARTPPAAAATLL